jgi:predicted O-linked N-acetylglucosamine transferase (SPINDLY family)
LNRGWIANLDRSRFHVTVFQIPRTTRKKDALATMIADSADCAMTLTTRLDAAREAIAGKELDILVYPDIGMDPHTYFFAYARLAPVQCVTWGHPVTTGLYSVDYFLSSRELDPAGSEALYTEKLVRLEDVNTYYYRPAADSGPRTLLLEESDSRLYVCVQTLFKLHPDYDVVLGEILRRDEKGKLVFIRGAEPYMEAQLKERFSRTIPDVADRVIFVPTLPFRRFLELLQIADVLLDTPFFGGGNTSLEAFGVGAPVVTWDRPLMRERITPALYRQMGIDDLIARNAEEYVELALRCANDKEWRKQLQAQICSRRTAIFENQRVVRQLEAFFEEALAAVKKA